MRRDKDRKKILTRNRAIIFALTLILLLSSVSLRSTSLANAEVTPDEFAEPENLGLIQYSSASDSVDLSPQISSIGNQAISQVSVTSSGLLSTQETAGTFVDPLKQGLAMNKTVTPFGTTDANERTIYKINLTATTTSNIVTTSVPNDIILVLDRSGSMTEKLIPLASMIYSKLKGNKKPSGTNGYYVKVSGTYFEVTRKNANDDIWSYVVGGTTFYVKYVRKSDDNLPGSTSSSSPVNKIFYTYENVITNIAKLDALKIAAKEFVNTVYVDSPESKIAVVSFANDATYNTGTSASDSLLNVRIGSNTVNSAITDAIDGLSAIDATHSNEGLSLANDIFLANADTTRNRVVILFTDGEPGNHGFDDLDGKRYAAAAINQSAVLKGTRGSEVTSDVAFDGSKAWGIDAPTIGNGQGKGATVYTIGVFPSTVNALVHKYMAWVSSDNKTNATSSSGHQYYFTADSSESLANIFDDIATETGRTINGVVVKDYVDPSFEVVDASGNAIPINGTITIDGITGTLRQDDKGTYVEWTKSILEPGTLENGKGFSGSLYVSPKDEFIGGNSKNTNIANISGLYANGINQGSFPNPLVNVPLLLKLDSYKDYILLGEAIPRTQAEIETAMTQKNLAYGYPAGMVTLAWDKTYDLNTKIVNVERYKLTATIIPKMFVDVTGWVAIPGGYKKDTGEIYNFPVGTTGEVTLTAQGEYAVIPVKPLFQGSTYEIFLGETAGDGGATTFGEAITLALPTTDVSGNLIPQVEREGLNGRLPEYESNVVYSANPMPGMSVLDPLSAYGPEDDTTLTLTARQNTVVVGTGIEIRINVEKGVLTINKTIEGTADPDQSFVFEIRQYGDFEKSQLVRTFYETIRVSDLLSNEGKRKIINLSKGYYEVTEKADWSWQYDARDGITVQYDTLGINKINGIRDPNKKEAQTSFINVSKLVKWLTSIDWVINVFTGGD